MAFAGKSDKKENVTAAITANVWMSNERSARGALPDEKLSYIVLDCLVKGDLGIANVFNISGEVVNS